MSLEQWSKNEKIFWFLGIPLILVLIYILPTSLKETYFILNKQAPSILSLFLSNYTHSELWHLATNLSSYLIVIYLIMQFETNKSCFYKTMAFLFLVVPFIVSFITIMYAPAMNSQGFSGIVAGLMGYFIYITYRHVKDTWKLNADINFVYLMVCANALIGVVGYWLTTNPAFAALLSVLLIGLIYYNRNLLKNIVIILRQKNEELKIKRHGLVQAYVTFTFVLLVLFSLPSLIQVTVQNGSIINAIGHYIGYVAGLTFSLVFIETKFLK